MSTQDVRAEALLNIRCIVKGSHLCRFEVNVGEVFNQEEGRTRKRVLSCEPSWTTRPSTVRARGSSLATTCRYFSVSEFLIWTFNLSKIKPDSRGRAVNVKGKEERLFSCWHENEWCLQLHAYKVSIPFPPIYNQAIPIYLLIGIDNRYQSITTRIFAMDWSSIININRLIDIDWYRLILIVIDYRFHRLDTPGLIDSDAKLSMYL